MRIVDVSRGECERSEAESGAGEDVVGPDRARGGDRVLVRRTCGRTARVRLRRAEPEQQVGAARDVRLHLRERLQCEPVEIGGLLVGERVQRALSAALGVVDGFGRVAERRGGEEMVGELGQVRLDRAAVDLLERLADGPVTTHPLLVVHVGEQRVADQAMLEAVLAERAGQSRDETHGGGLVERVDDAVASERRRALECRDGERAADDRGQFERLHAAVAEWFQAAADRLADAVRQRQLVGRIVEPALGGQQREHLADEERVALGRRVDRLHERGSRLDAARLLDQPADVLAPETAEQDAAPGTDDVLQRGRGLRRTVGNAFVHRDDEQHGGVAQHPRHEVERHERPLVDGVQVVDQDDDGTAGAARAQQRDERVEEREARGPRVVVITHRTVAAGSRSASCGTSRSSSSAAAPSSPRSVSPSRSSVSPRTTSTQGR